MFAVLGDVQFELITYFTGMDVKLSVQYAEHALINRKPRLQWTGDDLDTITLDLTFNAAFCQPADEFGRLKTILLSRQAKPLVLANGVHHGWFVLTELTATSKQTDKLGNLIALEAKLQLKEYSRPDPLQSRQAEAKQAAQQRVQAAPKKQAPRLTKKPAPVVFKPIAQAPKPGDTVFGTAITPPSTVFGTLNDTFPVARNG
jgi:phage protein U